jgi:hypothetical protein
LLAATVLLAGLRPVVARAQGKNTSGTETLPAEPQTGEAKMRFDEGVVAAQNQDFEKARVAFAFAFERFPNRAALFAWAQAERLSGHCDIADPLYRRFMRQPLGEAEQQAAELALRRCEQAPKEPAPASIVVEQKARPEKPSETRLTTRFLIFAGGATVAALTGLTFHGLAARGRNNAPDAVTYDAYRDALDTANRQTQWGWVGIGTGVVLGAMAGWQYHRDNATGGEENVPRFSTAVSPLIFGNTVGACWTGTLP